MPLDDAFFALLLLLERPVGGTLGDFSSDLSSTADGELRSLRPLLPIVQ